MATKNRVWFEQFSERYNVSYQIIKGNMDTVHVAIIGGRKYTALAQLNKNKTEQLFKSIAQGKHTNNENTIMFTNNGRVSINGNRYNVLDVLKNVSVKQLLDIMDSNKGTRLYYELGEWLDDWNNRLDYCKALGGDVLGDLTRLECYLTTGERVVRYVEMVEALDRVAYEWAKQEGVKLKEEELEGV